ncbi:hypothetical protein [Stenotrophomonas sp. CFBP 13725]|uniref:hypothetical protein n=1 Tax=Stenotrophomonas sp. CFBP 13725 TaxID=2775297 RepID=UPI00177DFAB6|nr:hypothetical protein [Stenotrophomonas sp. CFBP 13725]MBD8637695.1 hypothetical protein [Stenotrophomonas sp. CFBP 13725]
MDIPFPCIPSAHSAFATVSSRAAGNALPLATVPATVTNADATSHVASVPRLLRLAPSETGNDLVASLRRRCAEFGAPQLIDAGLTFIRGLDQKETAVFLRATSLALADDTRLGAALAAERGQGSARAPDAPAHPLRPQLQEYVDSLKGLRRAMADNGMVMDGTYGFTTFSKYCLERIHTAEKHYVAATVVDECLHWQRGARQAISGPDARMWPVCGKDPLGPVGVAFALDEPTPDAKTVLKELRQFHTWPLPFVPRSA